MDPPSVDLDPIDLAEESVPLDLVEQPLGVPTLQNVVSTISLACKLDLKDIALRARNAEYDPRRFSAVIMRIREPKTTALIFATGKMVCTGAKSEEESKLAARKHARIIQKLGYAIQFTNFKIRNIVGVFDMRFPISLERLNYSSEVKRFVRWEPEIFPGMVFQMQQPKISLLIFASGKVVFTGGKGKDDIYKAFENIYPVLTEYKKIVPVY